MTVIKDKRRDIRHACEIPVVITFLNSKHSMDAVLVDHCVDGFSFISNNAFFLGTAIIARIAYCTLKESSNSDIERLPSISMGEVKWCKKLPVEASTAYEVGIKYYPRVY